MSDTPPPDWNEAFALGRVSNYPELLGPRIEAAKETQRLQRSGFRSGYGVKA